MHKEVDVIEQPVKINMVVQPVDTEVQEPAVDVAVLVDDQDIEVEDVHIVDIEMTEAFPFMTNGALNEHMDDKDVLLDGGVAVDKNDEWVLLQDLLEISAGSGTVSHPDLHGRELSNQHPISAIENLQDNLDSLGATERVYSSSNGLGEFRQWKDGNPEGEDRSGYFVAIVPGSDEIEICDSTHDVYGISVHNSGFIGNQDDLYYKGNDLLNNNANDPSYAVVGIVGAMRVRTDGTARNGDYVVPNAYGEATLSENDYGYKVLSQGSYPSYNYVTIAITPQSDALSRLQSSVAGGDLGEILIKIDGIENSVGDLEVKVDASTEDIEDILGEIGDLQTRVTTAEEVAQDAATNAEEAKDVATQAASKAAQAQQDAQDAAAGAISSANQALSEVSDLASQMEPIVSWQSEDGLYNGSGGFVNQANEDHTILSSIVSGSGPDGSNLAAIMQKVDENGAIIQHLVSHVDRYVVGENSLSDGLTHDEAKAILTEEYIYVPTSDHDETMVGEPNVVTNFKRGYYYIWDVSDGVWVESTTQVSMATTYNDGSAEGDLWYCWQDVIVGDDAYVAGTLYRWFGSEWVAVATTADNHQARILTSIKQTADEIEMSVVASGAEGSTLKQKLDSIFTTVYDSDGYISSLEQTAESIRAGTYTESGTSSQLELLTSETNASLNAVASGRFHVVYHSFLGVAPDVYNNGNKYTKPPVWDDDARVFVFNDTYSDVNGTYYFTSEDQTKYCKVTDNGYDIYTIGNKVTSSLDNRISTTEAVLMGTAMLDTEDTSALSNITIQAKEDESVISSVASYYYHSLISVGETEIPVLDGQRKYNKPPVWNLGEGKYVFDIADRDDNGAYYLIDEQAQTYCRVITVDDGTVLYETYGLGDQSASYVLQKADANSAAIGMVVDHNGVKGSAIITAINGESEAQINADRVNIAASKMFEAVVGDDGTITPASIILSINNDTSDAQLSADRINLAASEMFSAIVGEDDTITPASIVAAINESESEVKIDANHVEINADNIDLSANKMFQAVVGEDGTITPASIIAAIDNTSGDTKVVLSADHINLAASEMFSAVVGEDGTITPASIVASINNSESEVIISADKINLKGYVTISDLSTAGKTTINGSNITTGVLQSANYSYTSGPYSTAGTKIDLANGAITSKNFVIDTSGTIYAQAAKFNNCLISGFLGLYSDSSGMITSYLSDSIYLPYMVYINSGKFSITRNGYVTVNEGLELLSTINGPSIMFKALNPSGTYSQLSHIDAYYYNNKYYSRWTTDANEVAEGVIKIHAVDGGVSVDAGPCCQLHLGTTEENKIGDTVYGQRVYVNSMHLASETHIYGTQMTIGAYGTTKMQITSDKIDLIGSVYLNGTLLTSGGSGGVAVFG